MTLNDDLIGAWARVYTDLPIPAVDDLDRRGRNGGADARDAKLDLAEAIVARYHGTSEAVRAREAFLSVFSDRKLPETMPELPIGDPSLTVLELVSVARPELTRSAIRRLITQGGVRINGAQQRDPQAEPVLRTGDVLQTGRRQWFRLTTKGGEQGS